MNRQSKLTNFYEKSDDKEKYYPPKLNLDQNKITNFFSKNSEEDRYNSPIFNLNNVPHRQKPQKVKSGHRELNGRDMYFKYMSGAINSSGKGGFFEECSHRWNKLNDSEKYKFKLQAINHNLNNK